MTQQQATADVAAVIVTYNRKALLLECLQALRAQGLAPARIVVVDNASTDGTAAALRTAGWFDDVVFDYLILNKNTGGAGGFQAGAERVLELGHRWMWLLDDDAIAAPDALAALFAGEPLEANLYASCAVYRDDCGNERLCWPTTTTATGVTTRDPALLAALEPSAGLPFLGFLVSAKLVRRIGPPEAGLFLSGDDMEYVMRARAAGADSFLVRDSRLHHPRPVDYTVHVAGREFFCLRLDPERRYYYVRNKVVIARRYLGRALYTQTLPGLLVRLTASLRHEPRRWQQALAYLRGVRDGFSYPSASPRRGTTE